MTSLVARGFVVAGRVQGVGFRWWTRREAERLGLGGSVWNRDDGSVEVHVVGPPRDVEVFRGLLAEGPPAARVERVQEVPVREESIAPGFRVVR